MEQEAFFVYVAYELVEADIGNHYVQYDLDVRRCTIERIPNGREKYDRICVDFDPYTKDKCFIVGFLLDKKDQGMTKKGLGRFCYVFDTEEEAEAQLSCMGKEHKRFLKQGEKLSKVMMWPALITKD